jgi:hypothetical protein
MRKSRIILVLVAFLLIPIESVYMCFASPSNNFYQEEDGLYDDWCVCRTSHMGADGFLGVEVTETGVWFRPLIAFESLGQYIDVAYSMGEQFVDKYPDREQRAEKVFEYVRDTVTYLPDIDQFGRDEYAVNADELATIIQKEGIAYGDCEDFAVLLAIMYQGADFRSALVFCIGHLAVLLYLPGYDKANVEFSLEGEAGWVWAEATGNTNSLGWCPVGQVEIIEAYEIPSEDHIDYCRLPAKFTLSGLTALPSPATVDDTVVISATIENVGKQSGDCVVSLSVGGYTDSKSVSSLDGGMSSGVSFSYAAKTAGTYTVTVSTSDTMATTKLTVSVGGEEEPSGGGCFIATAAYGIPMAEEIEILREFRDEYLLANPVGQDLVEFYYKVSPPIAGFITDNPSLKPIVRAGLAPAVALSAVAVNTSPTEKTIILGLLVLVSVAVAVWATKRRRRCPRHSCG